MGKVLSKDRPVSNYSLGVFERSPLHYWYYRTYDMFQESTTFDLGKMIHKLLLDPHSITRDFIIIDDANRPDKRYSMDAKANAAWLVEQKALAKKQKKECVTKELVAKAAKISENVFKNEQARELLTANGNRFEVEKKWVYDDVSCMGIIDIDNDYFLSDFKSAENAEPFEWQRKSWYYGYPRQGGMYLDGDAGGDYKLDSKPFFFIVGEKSPPYDVSVHTLSNDMIAYGIAQYRRMVSQIKACEKNEKWPGYVSKSHSGIFTWDLPKWLQNG